MKIILHGILAERFDSFEIAATSAADALEGWSLQCGMNDLPMDQRPLVEVLDFDTLDKLHAPLQVDELHLYPMMYGGGSFGKIVLGAVLIGIAIWNPVIGGMMLSQAGVTAVAAAGIGLALGGISQLFMKAPSVSKSEDPEASKYLGLGQNTTQIGTLIPKGYGRFLVSGHYLSIQVNANDMVYGTFPETVPA